MNFQETLFPGYTIGEDAYQNIPAVCAPFGKKAAIIGGKRALAAAEEKIRRAVAGSAVEITGTYWYGGEASVENIAQDVKEKFGGGTLGVIFPILSRNRFAICLKGIAKAFRKAYILMSYPSDEVGNHLFDEDLLDEKGVDPWRDVLTEEQYRSLFGHVKHPFTGVDYVEYYGELFRSQGCEVEFIFANDVRAILPYTKNVLCCDIHCHPAARELRAGHRADPAR